MLKKDTVDKIKSFGFDVDALINAIKADTEVDYTVPDIVALKPADLASRDENMKKDGEKEGEKKATGALIKELKTKLNITAAGERIGEIVASVQGLIAADGGTKLATMQQQIEGLTKDKETLSANLVEQQKMAKTARFEAGLIAKMPVNRSKVMTDEERIMAIGRVFEFDEVDGKTVFKRDGKVMADPNTHAPLSMEKVLTDYFTERSWIDAGAGGGGGGRGLGNQGGGGTGGVKSFSGAKASWLEANPGKNITSPEFMDHINDLAKADPTFDYNS